MVPAPVRLRAPLNSGVKVPDLASTLGPVAESNCIGATTPGGEQLEANDQSVTPDLRGRSTVNSIRPVVLASLLGKGRSPNKLGCQRGGSGERLAESHRWLETEWSEVRWP
jgi:hypothetical protein